MVPLFVRDNNVYVYWDLRYALNCHDLEETAKDRGLEVDHSTIQRWVVKYTPQVKANLKKKKKKVL